MKTTHWIFLALLLALPCQAEPKPKPKPKPKPNVLFLAVDDMNDWIGCLETTPRAITPNIDRLAARGVNFTNAHTAGVFCAPSRAAIFSGQFASTTGCYETANYFVSSPEIEALQMSFTEGGYTTLGAGKLFHHPAGAIDQRGWSEFFLRNQSQRENGWPLDSWSEETPFPDPFPASIYNEGRQVTGGLFLEWGAVPNEKEEEMADTIRINWAVEQLKKKHDKPFFLAAGIYAPHFPNYCPQKYFDLYDSEKIELPPIKDDDLEDLPEKVRKQKTARKKQHHDRLVELDAVDDAIHGYLACMSYADAMMGRVLDALEASPYADNTIVVFWSDHGYHHGEKGNWGKHTLWERTSNVPFIWAGPGVSEGAKTDVTASLIDMYPTLVEMCDLPKPHQPLEGESLAATLADPASANDRDVFLPHMRPNEYAIINRDWRYIRYGDDGEELYDLNKDPNEWNNLAGEKSYADVKAKLRSKAPATFAEPEERLNARKDLKLEGETFRWEKGAGNANPKPGYVPGKAKAGEKAKASSRMEKPNIVVIVSDDQGYADASYNPHSPPEVQTPHLAALAAESVICTNGYTSGHVCSPTRAGIMTGRYQQRFGVYTAGEGGSGMPLDEVWIPTLLKPAGYVSGAIGKWHLGLTPEYNAVNRGFDEFYGFMGRGAHPYFDHDDPEHPILRGLEPIKETGYLTTRITEEAVDFIDRQKENPFFLYLAYNAVHSPAEAPEEDIKPVTDDPLRNTLMGMLKHLDLGVRDVVGKLKEEGIFENTLLIYLSDNGGSKAMAANNAPLRGFKQEDFEGGIRVPFIVSWPAQLKGRTTCEVPVCSTDILPTILAAADLPLPKEKPLDGKNMLPALKGETDTLHDHLFWSSGGNKGTWAVRSGKWKLTGVKGEKWLYDLEADIGEMTDRKAEKPKVVADLQKAFDGWIAEMAEPLGGQPKVWTEGAAPAKKKKKPKMTREQKDAEREKEREARRAAKKNHPEKAPEELNP